MGRARIAEKSDDLACIVDAESLSALGQGSIQRGEAAAAEDETVKDAVGPESSDDLARAVDAKWVGVLGGQGIVDRGEDIDWHVVALLIADGCHQHDQLAIRGRRTIRADLTRAAAVCGRGRKRGIGSSPSSSNHLFGHSPHHARHVTGRLLVLQD